jgi:hypothetical protein
VHVFIRIIRSRVSYHRDFVAELSGKANGRFEAGMCYETDDDELMNAVLFELQIQIGVGKTTGALTLRRDDFAWFRLESNRRLRAVTHHPLYTLF